MNIEEFQSVLFKFSGGDTNSLNSLEICLDLLSKISQISGFNTLEKISHKFSPQGLSAVFILSESHIAIHTWPESRSGYISLTTCRKISNFNDIVQQIQQVFRTNDITFKEIEC